ncbi:MAG: Flp family type IVb pilin [Rhizobiales bacterium]|nr:Flp family type IVb pilin [Hyphomicrobiales bacterium]
MNLLAQFVKNESGATAIEYGLIASLISVVIISGASALGTSLQATFSGLAGSMKKPT